MKIAAALLMLFPTAGLADADLIAKYGPKLEKCYSEAADFAAKTACLGIFSGICMAEEEGGETTLGMSFCLHSASVVWDGLLNQEYARAKDWAVAMDQDDSKYFPEYANRVNALRDAQRAWITFRDAECELAYSVWGSGSMRHIAGNNCILDQTAKRTVQLWSLGDEMR